MSEQFPGRNFVGLGVLGFAIILGCGDDAAPPFNLSSPNSSSVTGDQNAQGRNVVVADSAKKSDDGQPVFELKPLSLSSLPGSGGSADSTSGDGKVDSEKQIQSIIARLQPLQILLGQWRGTTRREYENFKAVDNHEWVWDLRTDPERPALTIDSDKSPYLKKGRLSWDPETEKFTLTATDAAGAERTYTGDFSEPVHEIVGSDDKLHKVFRLEFSEDESAAPGASEYWQLAIAQQENNRYLLEVAKRRGSAGFNRFDTVSTQREGTSFAISDSGYAEKTCIISEGLGTTEVTYKGRSYWVCCSGCKAAFEEDPAAWIARAAARDKK